jgi:hypothetical protein
MLLSLLREINISPPKNKNKNEVSASQNKEKDIDQSSGP